MNPRKTYRQRAFDLSNQLGVSIEIDKTEFNFCVRVESPKNKHWSDDGIHQIVESQNAGHDTTQLWKFVLQRMSQNIEHCGNSCEWWD